MRAPGRWLIVATVFAAASGVLLARADPSQPPIAVDDTYATGVDAALTVPAPGILANDTDPEGNQLVVVLSIAPTASHGTLTFPPPQRNDGHFTYTPNPGFHGIDQFTYRAWDPVTRKRSNLATVTIAVDDPPVANDDAYTTGTNASLDVGASTGVLANDSDPNGDPISAVLDAGPANGGLTLNSVGSFQ